MDGLSWLDEDHFDRKYIGKDSRESIEEVGELMTLQDEIKIRTWPLVQMQHNPEGTEEFWPADSWTWVEYQIDVTQSVTRLGL